MLHLQLWRFYTECKCSCEIKEKNEWKDALPETINYVESREGGLRSYIDGCALRAQQHKKKLVIISVRDFHSYWQIKLKTKLGGRESEWSQLSKANTSRGPEGADEAQPNLGDIYVPKLQNCRLDTQWNNRLVSISCRWIWMRKKKRTSDKWKLFTHRYRKDIFKFL